MRQRYYYSTEEGRASMLEFIQQNLFTHTVTMIQRETGACEQFIQGCYDELNLIPLKLSDIRAKFLLDNPEYGPSEAAKAMKISRRQASDLLEGKISDRLRTALKYQKQTA